VEACNYDTLKLYGKAMDVEDIINDAAKDMKYYENSGGGITISGGEPLAQPEFTLELLKSAREKGIHTCIETSGYAARNIIDRILPYTDLFLFDYKATGVEKHRELTGASNELIHDNFDYIYNKGASIILRCPMIPGVNDSADYLEAIASISRKYPSLKGIEILPYHDMGRGKYKELGREYSLSGLKNAAEEQKNSWLESLHSSGCEKAKIG
jgi:pyruvate formate lyase activating enzyme